MSAVIKEKPKPKKPADSAVAQLPAAATIDHEVAATPSTPAAAASLVSNVAADDLSESPLPSPSTAAATLPMSPPPEVPAAEPVSAEGSSATETPAAAAASTMYPTLPKFGAEGSAAESVTGETTAEAPSAAAAAVTTTTTMDTPAATAAATSTLITLQQLAAISKRAAEATAAQTTATLKFKSQQVDELLTAFCKEEQNFLTIFYMIERIKGNFLQQIMSCCNFSLILPELIKLVSENTKNNSGFYKKYSSYTGKTKGITDKMSEHHRDFGKYSVEFLKVWDKVRKDFNNLCALMDEVRKFFSMDYSSKDYQFLESIPSATEVYNDKKNENVFSRFLNARVNMDAVIAEMKRNLWGLRTVSQLPLVRSFEAAGDAIMSISERYNVHSSSGGFLPKDHREKYAAILKKLKGHMKKIDEPLAKMDKVLGSMMTDAATLDSFITEIMQIPNIPLPTTRYRTGMVGVTVTPSATNAAADTKQSAETRTSASITAAAGSATATTTQPAATAPPAAAVVFTTDGKKASTAAKSTSPTTGAAAAADTQLKSNPLPTVPY